MKRSALFQIQSRQGARFALHHGWEMPRQFFDPADESMRVSERAGLADVSWMVKLDVKGVRNAPVSGAHLQTWQLGFSHYLVTCEPDYLASAAGAGYWTDVSSVWAQMLLTGPLADSVLRKLTSANVSNGAFRPGSALQARVAHAHAILLRTELGTLPAFHVLVSREYAESVWEAMFEAGHEFGIVPFGLEAHRLLTA